MPLRDILKKRDNFRLHHKNASKSVEAVVDQNPEKPPTPRKPYVDEQGPEQPFMFLRTTTGDQEVIYPPDFPEDDVRTKTTTENTSLTSRFRRAGRAKSKSPERSLASELSPRKRPGLFKKRSSSSIASQSSVASEQSALSTPAGQSPAPSKSEKRLSARLEKLHLGRSSRAASASSVHVPAELPEIADGGGPELEAEWERRAVLLARQNEDAMRNITLAEERAGGIGGLDSSGNGEKVGGDDDDDVDIQEAIRLHEEGNLTKSTAMFGRLANPKGHNNPLAQILYGMALQHGWGIPSSSPLALHYHTLAASNAATLELPYLTSDQPRGDNPHGGPAKGELVLAIYELGNAFRHGWGCEKDLVAARRYYECAAELGDVDAMVEVAWCWEEGAGGGKDRYKAARYLRMAEDRGRVEIGNSWIWKDKYGGPKKAK